MLPGWSGDGAGHDQAMDVDDANARVGRLLAAWNLDVDGDWWSTPSSLLARIRRRDDARPYVLKIPLVDEERTGSRVLAWWHGEGAAFVYAMESGGAVLMERAQPGTPLLDAAESAIPPDYVGDDDATRHLIEAALRLHHCTGPRPEGLR